MATLINNHLISTIMPLLVLVLMLTLDFTDAQLGVCYGGNGNDLPSKADIVALCNQYNIRRLRIYDPDQGILQAASGSNIELIVGVPNDNLQSMGDQANADAWVQNNIKSHPEVKFRYIAVGNEVNPTRPDTSQYTSYVFRAMQNIYNAISSAGLAGQIKVSTVLESGVLENTYPPGNSVFKSGDVMNYVDPIIRFLVEKDAPLLVNVYPYFSYTYDKANIPLPYALFTSDGENGYQNLFYALVDSMYYALEKSGGSSLRIVVAESGWPSDGGDAASLDNAKTYYTNLVQRVKDGTPKRPGAIETYLFSLIDENGKSPEIEKHFGVFRSNKEPKYGISFD